MPRDTNVPQEYPQAERKHPEPYQRDLSPNRMAGQNIGLESAGERARTCFAADIKELVTKLSDFSMDELREIPVVQRGERLSQGRTYLDLAAPSREPFTAMGSMTAEEGSWLVPKAETPPMYWNRLIHAKPAYRRE